MMSLRQYTGSFVWPVVAVVVFSIACIAIILWLLFGAVNATAADTDTPCLTHAQAKAKYPGQWLYWRTERRCWYGQSTGRTTSRAATWGKENSLKLARPLRDPNGNVTHHSGRPLIVEPPQQQGPTVFYPSLMAGGGTADNMLRSESITRWPALMDVDEPPQFIPWNERINLTATFEEGR